MNQNLEDRYLTQFAAAFVRGTLGIDGTDHEVFEEGRKQKLKLHRFKRSELPRVLKCVGLLKGLHPETLLDVGTGRGVFLWTMLEQVTKVEVTCLDLLEHRVRLVNTVRKGGIKRIQAQLADAQKLDFPDSNFDVVTALEVLEHMPNPSAAVRELSRVGKRYLLVSVPSKPDNNPEHINLFSASELEDLLRNNGCQSVQMHHVLNHRIALGKIEA